jgi:hypothetical protein
MHNDQPPPPDNIPRGILYLLEDPAYVEEYEFSQRLTDAQEKGKLYAPPNAKLH